MDNKLRFIRHTDYDDLPRVLFTGEEHKDDAMVKEFDHAFDLVASALRELHEVDADGGDHDAPIYMTRYVDICRQHTIVVARAAWHPGIVTVLYRELQKMPEGWTLQIDATDFPPGQAYVVVTADGTVHGWAEFRARRTLTAFGFPGIGGLVPGLLFAVRSAFGRLRKTAFRRPC
ncbi:MAG: hypothetical protein KF712_18410 [Akkermansiaceae bacterium]|nr:hypothetical protein [Akkermansiaceae bacterium]